MRTAVMAMTALPMIPSKYPGFRFPYESCIFNRQYPPRLRDNLLHDFPMHISQPELAALEAVGEALVVEA